MWIVGIGSGLGMCVVVFVDGCYGDLLWFLISEWKCLGMVVSWCG